jgi:hypothetical protein
LDFDSDDVGADEVAIIDLGRIPEMLADGTSDESFDLGRRLCVPKTSSVLI